MGLRSLLHRFHTDSGAHPTSYRKGILTPGVKRPGREADHSPPSIDEFKNALSYASSPPYVFMTWCLVTHRDKFTFNVSVQYNPKFIQKPQSLTS
jgi:hypothetical protein